MTRVYFFGCWNQPGHYLFGPGGTYPRGTPFDSFTSDVCIDANYAPRRARGGTQTAHVVGPGGLCWGAQGAKIEDRQRIHYDSDEHPQGEFLIHRGVRGFTLMSWWDRCQGDERSACNSTLLVEGEHDASAMLAELAARFPHVLDNLRRAGVELREARP